MNKMGKKPDIVYTDDEGTVHKPSLQTYVKEQQTFHYITQKKAWFAEISIITVEFMLYKRIDQGKQEQPQWIDFVYPITLPYNNNMVRSSIKMTPYEATKPSNAIDVKK